MSEICEQAVQIPLHWDSITLPSIVIGEVRVVEDVKVTHRSCNHGLAISILRDVKTTYVLLGNPCVPDRSKHTEALRTIRDSAVRKQFSAASHPLLRVEMPIDNKIRLFTSKP
ncbi:hypothetical protein SNK05_010272 [Fusarium graminearum]